MANNTNRNRWTITLDVVVNFRHLLLEDKFTTVPEIRECKPDDPQHNVFEIDLPGYGMITILASGRFTFKPLEDVCVETFSKRFFSGLSFQKVACEFVSNFLSLKPVKKEEPKQEQKKLPAGKVGHFDMATGKFIVNPEYKKKMEAQEQKKPAKTQTVMDRPHAFLNMATGELLDENKKSIKTKYDEPEKKEHGKNALGHIKNSMADLLDKLFLEGVTEEELLEHGITRARYRSHFRHLENDKMELVQVKFENGKYSAMLLN